MANIFSAEIARIQEAIRITQANIARDRALLAQDPTNERLKIQIASSQNYLIDLDAQLAFFGVRESAPVASSGDIVRDDAVATVDRTQTPLPEPQILAPGLRCLCRQSRDLRIA